MPVCVIACSGNSERLWGPLLVSPLRGHVAVGHGLYADGASAQFRNEALPPSLSEHPTILSLGPSCRPGGAAEMTNEQDIETTAVQSSSCLLPPTERLDK